MKKELDVAANPKFYEVMFNDGFSIAIKGIREPTLREAAQFCGYGFGCPTEVKEIPESDVIDFFDHDNIESWPVFGVPYKWQSGGRRIDARCNRASKCEMRQFFRNILSQIETAIGFFAAYKQKKTAHDLAIEELRAYLAQLDASSKYNRVELCWVVERVREACRSLDTDPQFTGQIADIIIKYLHTAYGVRPRNCDIGTVAEQRARCSAYCLKYHNETGCSNCPLCDTAGDNCQIVWANLPYREEEKGDKK